MSIPVLSPASRPSVIGAALEDQLGRHDHDRAAAEVASANDLVRLFGKASTAPRPCVLEPVLFSVSNSDRRHRQRPPDSVGGNDRGDHVRLRAGGGSGVVEHRVPGRRAAFGRSGGVALRLSGDVPTSLFHLGAMGRLDRLRILSKVDTFASVSGGSIALAQLASHRRGLRRPLAGSRLARRIPRLRKGVIDADHVRPAGPFMRRSRSAEALVRPEPRASTPSPSTTRPGRPPAAAAGFPERRSSSLLRPDCRFRTQWARRHRSARLGSDGAGFAPIDDSWPLARAVAASSCFPRSSS